MNLKRALAILLIFLSAPSLFAQVEVFKDLDFSSGDYHLLCIQRGDVVSRAQVGEWVSRDTSFIQELKKQLVFSREDRVEASMEFTSTYQIALFKNDSAIDHFYVNPELNEVRIRGDVYYYNYDDSFSSKFELTPISKRIGTFETLDVARAELDLLSKNDSVVYIRTPDWKRYEGSFYFTYFFPEGNDRSYRSYPDSIKNYISNKYGTDNLDVQFSSTNGISGFARVKCNKQLFDTLKNDRLIWATRSYTDSTFNNSFQFEYKTDLFGFQFPKIKEVGNLLLMELQIEFDSKYPTIPHEVICTGFGGGTSAESPFRFIYTLKSNENLFDSFEGYEGTSKWEYFNWEMLYYKMD